MTQRLTEPTAEVALLTSRLVCIAMILGQVVFLGLAVFLVVSERSTPNAHFGRLLTLVGGAMLIVTGTLGFIIRSKMWQKRPVPPSKFILANILFFALLESPAFVGITAILIGGTMWPGVLIPVIAILVQAMAFPNPSPMEG